MYESNWYSMLLFKACKLTGETNNVFMYFHDIVTDLHYQCNTFIITDEEGHILYLNLVIDFF